MVSYAQNGEDVLLDRLFPVEHRGLYIDVGANHPVFHSVTKHFYDRGWKGINVEPLPRIFAELERQRTRDINLNAGLSDRDGTLTIWEPVESNGEATFSEEKAQSLRGRGYELVEHEVAVTTLGAVCARYLEPGTTIDFLKVDVEEHERPVLLGADWTRWRPRVLVIEGDPARWEDVVVGQGYLVAARDGVNRYYVREEDSVLAERLADPANVLDDYVTYEVLRRDEEIGRLHEELSRQQDQFLGLHGAYDDAMATLRRSREELEAVSREVTARVAERDEARVAADAFRRELLSVGEVLKAAGRDLDVSYRRIELLESEVDQLRGQFTLDDGEMIGPASVGAIRRLRGLSRRFPVAARAVKRLVG